MGKGCPVGCVYRVWGARGMCGNVATPAGRAAALGNVADVLNERPCNRNLCHAETITTPDDVPKRQRSYLTCSQRSGMSRRCRRKGKRLATWTSLSRGIPTGSALGFPIATSRSGLLILRAGHTKVGQPPTAHKRAPIWRDPSIDLHFEAAGERLSRGHPRRR